MSECIKTTCPYCGVGCGVEVTVVNSEKRRIQVKGDPDHPANFGRLCSKGAALHETVGLQRRQLVPQSRRQAVHWNEALNEVANGFRTILDKYGPQSVAIYGSGQLLTEDYYIANKLMKGYIGGANIDTNSRLCMASAVVAHQRAFGEDLVPCHYSDLEQADLVLLVGSNTAWCHPVLYQRLVAAKEKRPEMKVVVLDTRRTMTAEVADLFLPLRTNADLGFFMGLLAWLAGNDQVDKAFVAQHVDGADDAIRASRERFPDIASVADYCGLSASDVAQCFNWFADTERVVTAFSQGVNQSVQASDAINAIINCHLATGRIGRPGMGPFSLTGQPNAMGGREVGGMASILAAHMDFSADNVERVARFWGVKQVASSPGLKAVDMFDAIYRGEIKAVWILATNPAVSLPDAAKVREALARCEFVVVSEAIADTDTARYADVVLPAATWGERDGTVTNSERRVSRQRPLFPLPGQVKPDWWALCEVAKRMGFGEGFNFDSSHAIFSEYAAMTGFENHRDSNAYRSLNLGALAPLSSDAFNEMAPQQWPLLTDGENVGSPFLERLSGSGFRANMLAVTITEPLPEDRGDLVLNTGRLRDHWHTMSRTGLSPRLSRHIEEPFVAVSMHDVQRFELTDGGFARVVGPRGNVLLPVVVTPDQPAGQVFVPIHWTDAIAGAACVSRAVHGCTDAPSGQPDSKATRVTIAPVTFCSFSRWFLRQDLDLGQFGLQRGIDYWVKNTCSGGYRYDIASTEEPAALSVHVRQLLSLLLFGPGAHSEDVQGQWLERTEPKTGRYRGCLLQNGELVAAVFFDRSRDQLPPSRAIEPQFTAYQPSLSELSALVNVQDIKGCRQRAAICACANVDQQRIDALRASGEAASLDQLMTLTAAGKNCGSCLPELRAIYATAEEVQILHVG